MYCGLEAIFEPALNRMGDLDTDQIEQSAGCWMCYRQVVRKGESWVEEECFHLSPDGTGTDVQNHAHSVLKLTLTESST